MRVIVKITSVIVAFAATLFTIALFLPSQYVSENTVEVAVNSDSCLSLLRSPATWSSWMLAYSGDVNEMNGYNFHPDAHFVQKGINGAIIQEGIFNQVSLDTIWIEGIPAGSMVRWKSKLQCDYPFGRFMGLLSRYAWVKRVRNSLTAFQNFADESTIGPPVQIKQYDMINDR